MLLTKVRISHGAYSLWLYVILKHRFLKFWKVIPDSEVHFVQICKGTKDTVNWVTRWGIMEFFQMPTYLGRWLSLNFIGMIWFSLVEMMMVVIDFFRDLILSELILFWHKFYGKKFQGPNGLVFFAITLYIELQFIFKYSCIWSL